MVTLKSAFIVFSTTLAASQAYAGCLSETIEDMELKTQELFMPQSSNTDKIVKEIEAQSTLIQDLIIQGISAYASEGELVGTVTLTDLLAIPDMNGSDLRVAKVVDSTARSQNLYYVEIGRGDNGMGSFFELKGTFTVGGRTINNLKLVSLTPDGDAAYCNY